MKHREASELAATLPCVLCGLEGSSVPAHLVHRGTAHRENAWDRDRWEPLCGGCHSAFDGRAGWKLAVLARARMSEIQNCP